MGTGRGLCEGPRAASYRGQARREQEGIQEGKKLASPRTGRMFSLVVGTASDRIKCLLSRITAL